MKRQTQHNGRAGTESICFEELARMCNRKRPSAVAKWAQSRGIRTILDADARPTTTASELNRAIERSRKTEPKFKFATRP